MRNFYRREVLKGLAAAGLSAGILPFGIRKMAFAEGGTSDVLIVVHLRGGCDGLNFISPSNDPDFVAARLSDLRVLDDGKDAGYTLANPMASGVDFRLHNAAGGLAELYRSGDLAFIHACGLTDATRSHFVATDMIEAGVGSQVELSRSDKGWITRNIEARPSNSAGLEAVAVNGSIAGDMRGLDRVISTPDISNGLPPVGGASVATALWHMYEEREDFVGRAGKLALQLPVIVDEHVLRDPTGKPVPYVAENGANYDGAAGFASTMKSVARLVKMGIGLKCITLDYGAWDTHENQAGRFRSQIEPLSNGLLAFWNDISVHHNRVTLVTLTEFGRRLRGNKSNGTDHGRASVVSVLGGNVKGGKMYGKWPGLSSSQLDEGVDLAVTTDYRQVLTEILQNTSGPKSSAFPGFEASNRLALFG